MDKPIVANNKPAKVSLTAGEEYHFCTCGRSSNQPFCDGSHAGTSFTPRAFTAEKTDSAWLCQCKHSADAPFCDGSHKRFSDSEVGQPGDGIIARVEGMPVASPTPEEPTVAFIHQLAQEGLREVGHHGPMGAMGVPRKDLPDWNDLQLMVAQLSPKPLMEQDSVGTELVIGPEAAKPLSLSIPLFVSDMSFGALSEEAKVSMARGAELAGTGICSGEGGMLPDEQAANCHYFYELASARFGYREELLAEVQAFHFKGGQGAKTGTGGHLPGAKNIGRIAEVRGIEAGQPAISPPTFADLDSVDDFARFSDRVREVSGGIPVGFKLSANHIERDIQFALDAGADYIILDGRGGGTGAAPPDVQGPYQCAHYPSPCPSTALHGPAGRQRAGHPHYYRRSAHAHGLRESPGTGSRRYCACKQRHASHRLRGCADVQHQQLPSRHRYPEAGVAGQVECRRGCTASGEISSCLGGAYAGDGQGMRAQPLEPVQCG